MEMAIPNRSIDARLATQEPAVDPDALAELRELQEEGEPDVLSELVETFLADAEPRLASLREAVNHADASVVERDAHRLKGSCAYLGARQMSAFCDALQSAGRSGDLADAPALLVRLEAEYLRVRAALSAELSTG